MAICGCGLPARCSQPAVAGGVIYADLWGELSTHLAPQALFTQSSPVREPLLQAFPFPSTGKRDTAPTFSGLHVCLQLTWEVGLPPSPVEFSSHCRFYKLSRSWLLGVCRRSCLLQPGLFIYSSVRDFSSTPFGAQGAPPSLLCVFIVLIAYYSVSLFFSLGGGRFVQGAMLIWPRVVCGSTVYCLAHVVVHVFPSHLGAGVWWPGGLLVSPFNMKWRCPT
jgi:hypothetical protein